MASRYRSPADLLDELGITEPEDIDVEAIAFHCRAFVRYRPLEGCEARIIGFDDRAIISVNQSSMLARQRFSIAHELGHWMQDQGSISFACGERIFTTAWSEDNPERRANRYAADLLMPEQPFRRLAKNQEITFATVRRLARTFRTSLVPTAITLVHLGSFPCMIICNNPNKRLWFSREADVGLWPNDRPGRSTIAYDLMHGIASVESPQDVCADGWIDHPESGRYEIREDSLRIPIPDGPDLVLSLLWWKDERQLLDLDEE